MEKVKVSREVAEFIESYEDNVNGYPGWENHLILEHSRMYFESFEGAKEECLCMKNIDPLQLAEMLVNGYEIEQTPAEKVLEFLEASNRGSNEAETPEAQKYHTGVSFGIRHTLSLLNIKIKGVNDFEKP